MSTAVPYLILGSAFIVSFWFLRPRSSRQIDQLERLVTALPPADLNHLLSLIDVEDGEWTKDALWEAVGGGSGLRVLDIRLGILLLILQACVARGIVKKDDILPIQREARVQLNYSRLAKVEAWFCKLFPEYPHIFAAGAITMHCKITIDIRAICQVDGAPQCILDGSALL